MRGIASWLWQAFTEGEVLGWAGSRQSSAECGDRDWKPATGRPRLPPGALPPSYPQAKLPILDNPALFEKLDSEALFFSFYYQPGSYQQYLAARELKRQSWRYHKQHGAWFQVRTVREANQPIFTPF